MKKNLTIHGLSPCVIKVLKVMKLTVFLMLISFIGAFSTETYAQVTKLSLRASSTSLEKLLMEIEEKSEFRFFYTGNIDVDQGVSVNVKNKKVTEILDEIKGEAGFKYEVMDRQIVLSPAGAEVALKSIRSMDDQQQKSVSGKVTDSSGQPLPGVTVILKGTVQGTITNTEGDYSISNIPEDGILQFSFVGMRTTDVIIGTQSIINISMEIDAIGIDEVVAVGYGTQKKVNLTGAVSAVTGDKIADRAIGQTSMALQGLAPGVSITQRSGQPGSDNGTIRVRGIGTLNDSNPLILVDGTEMDINNIDPSLIESISVLKDAASSAIYGSRAANGVILVTTKRAEKDELTITYKHYSGIQTFTNLPVRVGAIDHMSMLNEAYVNSGRTGVFSDKYIQDYKANMATNPDQYPDVDWQSEVYKNLAYQQNNYLTIVGGTNKARILAGVGYFKQDGLIPNSEYKRISSRINSDIQFSDKLSAKLDVDIVYNQQLEPGRGVNDVVYWVSRSPAIYPAKLTSGEWAVGWDGDNVLAFANDGGYR